MLISSASITALPFLVVRILKCTLEFGPAPQPSNLISQRNNNSGWQPKEQSLSKFEVALSWDKLGTFNIGQGGMSGRRLVPNF